MSKWRCDWRFNNSFDSNHGKTGTEEVSAGTDMEAREGAKNSASRKLFGTTMMRRYVDITGSRQIKS